MFRMETEVDKRRVGLLRSRLRDTNTRASPALRALRETVADREIPVQVWAFGEDDELAGGCDAHAWGGWLHVNLLWVDERHRGTGLGSRLLADTERRAREEHGCARSRVWTWDFQAPDFYRRYGYEVICALPDYPPGITEYTLVKTLV
ncbi:GNAT family N-acetyltransferase [Streptomyces uncialis]|nr:GNAT family N-acetyltransferase [Streptomyces uncialis]MCX4660760.1 GNAT family N-acetyltransferase [Streptomyces uncialis]WST68755.1 GNAT family N-acetyltransferase [Streptomyces uncialis]WTE12618.1 GNAT family N-acetyltransferase [Streptomyces uncialis]